MAQAIQKRIKAGTPAGLRLVGFDARVFPSDEHACVQEIDATAIPKNAAIYFCSKARRPE